jgi:hypothetical protein
MRENAVMPLDPEGPYADHWFEKDLSFGIE